MKKLLTFTLVFALAITLGYGFAFAGNGAPSGPHYNLNIIGVENTKSKDFNVGDFEEMNSNGHRIFVKLDGKTKIMLREGDYEVIDYNGTDGIAMFQLPNPDPEADGTTEYSVWVRGLGSGGSATVETCAYDETGQLVCSSTPSGPYILTINAHGNNNKFTDVSRYLLYVYADLDGNGNYERYPLFNDTLEDYFWDYNNNGLKLAQFRFYPIPTEVQEPPLSQQ